MTDRRGTGKTASAVTDNAVVTGTNQAPEFDGTVTATREFPENKRWPAKTGRHPP